MSSTKTLVRSFAGGEITPEMYGRLDNVKTQTGLALGLNVTVLPHGPACKRPGTLLVNKAGKSTHVVRVIPFKFNIDQSMVVELGHLYVRFHTQGATLLNGTPAAYNGATPYTPGDLVTSGGNKYVCIADTTGNAPPNAAFWYQQTSTAYELPSPYADDDVFEVRYTQNADIMTLTAPGYAIRELRRYGASKWELRSPTVGALVPPPGTPTVAVTPGTGTAYNKDAFYKVTAVSEDGTSESLDGGASLAASNDLTLSGAKNVISWTASSLASPSYRIYKAMNDVDRLYGFLGETVALSFTDDNIAPDYSHNPPSTVTDITTAAGDRPTATCYFEQRRVFGGTDNKPQGVYATRSGTETDLTTSKPSNSGDALIFGVQATQQNRIMHLVPLSDLLAFTEGAIFRIFSDQGPLLPDTTRQKPQVSKGSNRVTPALTGTACLYAETTGKRLREIEYSWQAQSFVSNDRSIMAPHLFVRYTIDDMTYVSSPDSLWWGVRSDGKLLSMAYVPEHEVFGLSQHDTQGYFESVCTITENNEDAFYLVVNRIIEGVDTRCIERMASRIFIDQEDAFHVDCGLIYDGAPATVFNGLDHLNGYAVSVLADGIVVEGITVSGGSITLDTAASVVHVGLPYSARVQLLPLSLDSAPAAGQGTVLTSNYAYARMNDSGTFKIGPSFDNMTDIVTRTDEDWGDPTRLFSGVVDALIYPSIGYEEQLCFESSLPLPFTLSSVAMLVTVGG